MPRPARLEWLIAGKGRQAGREEQQEDAAAEIGRRQEAMADRRPADNRWQGEERQCRRGHELQARRPRERRRRLAGVDSQGRTLYLLQKDSGTTSSCTGACAAAWPPLRSSGNPVVLGAANASLVGTTARSDGKPQATYNGHPLYSFVMDTKSGDANGEGLTAFGGTWFAVSPAGNPVVPPAPAAPKPKPHPKPKPQPTIPQGNGGDHDSDNNGGPDDGDGGI